MSSKLTMVMIHFSREVSGYQEKLHSFLEENNFELTLNGTVLTSEGGLKQSPNGVYYEKDTPELLESFKVWERNRLEKRLEQLNERAKNATAAMFPKSLELGINSVKAQLANLDQVTVTPHELVANALSFTYPSNPEVEAIVPNLINTFIKETEFHDKEMKVLRIISLHTETSAVELATL